MKKLSYDEKKERFVLIASSITAMIISVICEFTFLSERGDIFLMTVGFISVFVISFFLSMCLRDILWEEIYRSIV